MDEFFVARRITELRMAKNISEYRLSLALGQGKGYIQGITSGKYQPSMKQLMNIADFFNMTLSEFFDEGQHDSPQIREIVQELRTLPEEDVRITYELVRRLAEKQAAERTPALSQRGW